MPDETLTPSAIQGTYSTRALDNTTAPTEFIGFLSNLGVTLNSDGKVLIAGQSNTAFNILEKLLGASFQNRCTWSVNGELLSINLVGKKFMDFQIISNDDEKLQLRYREGGSFFGLFLKQLGIDFSNNKAFNLTLRKNKGSFLPKELIGNFTYGAQNKWGADITNALFGAMFKRGITLSEDGQVIFAGLQENSINFNLIKTLCGGKFNSTWKVESGLLQFMINGQKFMDFNIIDNNEDYLKLSFNSANSGFAKLFDLLGIDFQSSNSFNLTLNR